MRTEAWGCARALSVAWLPACAHDDDASTRYHDLGWKRSLPRLRSIHLPPPSLTRGALGHSRRAQIGPCPDRSSISPQTCRRLTSALVNVVAFADRQDLQVVGREAVTWGPFSSSTCATPYSTRAALGNCPPPSSLNSSASYSPHWVTRIAASQQSLSTPARCHPMFLAGLLVRFRTTAYIPSKYRHTPENPPPSRAEFHHPRREPSPCWANLSPGPAGNTIESRRIQVCGTRGPEAAIGVRSGRQAQLHSPAGGGTGRRSPGSLFYSWTCRRAVHCTVAGLLLWKLHAICARLSCVRPQVRRFRSSQEPTSPPSPPLPLHFLRPFVPSRPPTAGHHTLPPALTTTHAYAHTHAAPR